MKIKALRDLSEYGINLQEVVGYRHGDDAGIDLITCEPVHITPFNFKTVPSGVAVEFPSAHFGRILPRSGLALSKGIQILGGVIDNGFRGEIIINLLNSGREAVAFPVGARIAQLVVLPYYKAKLEWTDDLSETQRGKSGHGSTGI